MSTPDAVGLRKPERGTFLVAAPQLLDPNFMHAVVLLCDHGPDGSYGLIVNRPGRLTVRDLQSDAPLLDQRDDRLWLGGPIQLETLQVLHRLGPGIPGALHVIDDVHLGGDPAVLHAALGQRHESRELVRFVLGYSGWGAGQLEAEIAEGTWVVCDADEASVFDARPESVWRRVLRGLGGAFAHLADVPPDPSWN